MTTPTSEGEKRVEQGLPRYPDPVSGDLAAVVQIAERNKDLLQELQKIRAALFNLSEEIQSTIDHHS
jgi:hypothetical protein